MAIESEHATGATVGGLARASTRDVVARTSVLSAWDDYPIHQTADVISSISDSSSNWAERYYFNVLRPSGELDAIIGVGVYPNRRTIESYFCKLVGDTQHNVRCWGPLTFPPESTITTDAISMTCEAAMDSWHITVDHHPNRFAGYFKSDGGPYLYDRFDIGPAEPDGPVDQFRHFVATGRWTIARAGQEGSTTNDLVGVRDRTWGIRSNRPRLHNWYVFKVGSACVTLVHQELADGTVHFSEAGVCSSSGHQARFEIRDHNLDFHPESRQLRRGEMQLRGPAGQIDLEFETVGQGIRLLGAGYDNAQGRHEGSGVESDEYDLSDSAVVRTKGRGTLDSGARVSASGLLDGEGIGVIETALARNHIRYGHQVDPSGI